MNRINIYQRDRVGNSVLRSADPNTSHILYLDSKPIVEIAHYDKRIWTRRYGYSSNEPFTPAGTLTMECNTIKDIKEHYESLYVDRTKHE